MMIKELARKVASEFFEGVGPGKEFETFADMRFTYDWSAKDIRDEISYIAQALVNEEFSELVRNFGQNIPHWELPCVLDDGSVEDCKEYMSYGQFKKLVFSYLK